METKALVKSPAVRLSVTALLCVGIFFQSAGASASISSWLAEVTGKAVVQGGNDVAALAAVASRSMRSASALTVDDAGRLMLMTYAAGAYVASVVVGNADDLVRLVDKLGEVVLVTPETIQLHGEPLKQLLRLRPNSVEIVSKDGGPTPLRLEARAQHESFVVVPEKDLTFSPEAWAKRTLLNQALMTDLAARLRVIALVSQEDRVLRKTYQTALGGRVVFAASEEEFTSALAESTRRLVAIVGHVEDGKFVLQSAGAANLIKRGIASVHTQVDSAQSVALILGCRVACEVNVSGPTTLIDGFDVVNGLRQAERSKTPMDFLREFALQVGPMHIDTDMFGRLRAVSDARITVGDAAARTHMLFSNSISAPVSGTYVLAKTIYWIIAMPLFMLSGWVAIFFVGLAPRRGWREIKQIYASLADREDHEIDDLARIERALLFLIGPWLLFLCIPFGVIHVVLNGLLWMLALLSYPLIRLINPGALHLSHQIEIDPEITAQPVSFRDGRDVALIACVSAACLAFVSAAMLAAWSTLSEQSVAQTAFGLGAVGYLLGLLATRRFEFLIRWGAIGRNMFMLVPRQVLKSMVNVIGATPWLISSVQARIKG